MTKPLTTRFLLIVCALLPAPIFPRTAHAAERYPSVDELPAREKLADQFRFFGQDRRVRTRADWEERRAEIRRLIQHYSCGPAFPQTHNARVVGDESSEIYDGKATLHKVNLQVGPDHAIACWFEYVMPKAKKPTPLIVYICPRREFAEETVPWRERIVDRGYAFAWVIPGQFNGYGEHGPVKDAFPEVKGNTMMAWVYLANSAFAQLRRVRQCHPAGRTFGCSVKRRRALPDVRKPWHRAYWPRESERRESGGGNRIRTCEGIASRFTVCPV